MSLFMSRKQKEKLLSLQRLLVKDSPDKLICSEAKLNTIARQTAANSLRIVQDCISILQTTTDPTVFFSRFSLLVQHAKTLSKLERYVTFSGASPTKAFAEIMNEKQECIQQFLIRYFGKVFDKAEKLKTPKGKMNQYQKFYDSLKPYYGEMDIKNIDYIETKYKTYTGEIKL